VAVPFAVAAGASGCAANEAGGAAPAAPATQDFEKSKNAKEAEPATIEEAQAQLERARAALAGAPAGGPAGAATTGDLEQKKAEAPAGGEPAETRGPDRCATACNAMASMKRAVDAICRMAGEADARCTTARKTADESQAKVVGCGC
jgi:hypothetical protein